MKQRNNPDEELIQGPMYRSLWILDLALVETPENYTPGGFHPVELEDTIDGRYEVFEKLGHGGSSTVWLCLDKEYQLTRWCALKILTASQSSMKCSELKFMKSMSGMDLRDSHIQLPCNHFWIEGPNGKHLCFVLPVLGPSIKEAVHESVDFQKDVLFQAAEGLQFLHQMRICHGDFRTANILLRLPDLNNISKEEMRELFGPSQRKDIYPTDPHGPKRAPRYLVQSSEIRIKPTSQIAIIDLGVHFHVSDPPESCPIPTRYASPEAWLGVDIGYSLDIWALVCTIVKVRTGNPMFWGGTDRSTAASLELQLGPLPEPYNSLYRKRRSEAGRNAAHGASGSGEPVSLPGEFFKLVLEGHSYDEGRKEKIGTSHVWRYPEDGKGLLDKRRGRVCVENKLPEEEVQVLADLLRRSFSYNPKERLGLTGVMNHEWFDGRRKAIKAIKAIKREKPLGFGACVGLIIAFVLALRFWI